MMARMSDALLILAILAIVVGLLLLMFGAACAEDASYSTRDRFGMWVGLVVGAVLMVLAGVMIGVASAHAAREAEQHRDASPAYRVMT